jgi:outer membrane lipoprotein SlyB
MGMASDQPEEPRGPVGEVRAAFPDLERARKAIDALERSGVEGGHISLEGRPAREAAEETDTRAPDARVTRLVTRRTAIAAILGGVVGGVAGFLLGLALSGDAALLATTLGGVIAGGAVGGVIGGVSSVDMSQAWELTQHRVEDGPVRVAVQTSDRDELARAEETLRAEDPLEVVRDPAGGSP